MQEPRSPPPCALPPRVAPCYTHAVRTRYYGGNLDILQRYLDDESVALVYIAAFGQIDTEGGGSGEGGEGGGDEEISSSW